MAAVTQMREAYLETEYEDAEIERVLKTYKLQATRPENSAHTAAELLADAES